MQLILLVALCVGLGGTVSMSPAAERNSKSAVDLLPLDDALDRIAALQITVNRLGKIAETQGRLIEDQDQIIRQSVHGVGFSSERDPQANTDSQLVNRLKQLELKMKNHEEISQKMAEMTKNVEACGKAEDHKAKSVDRMTKNELIRHVGLGAGDLGESVAFSAFGTNGAFIYNTAQIINFEDVEYNSGSYDPGLSVFECPVTGLYWFSINLDFYITSSESYSGEVNIVKGNTSEPIATVYDYYVLNGAYKQSTNNVITMCNIGENVYAKAARTSRITGSSRRTTFSGLLLAK